ncbi:MAG TPA: hypothetical protein VGP80_15065 [Gemmatimonadales bacterium]|nr:hypothetical protein [Gemmatimonadales bacterium]
MRRPCLVPILLMAALCAVACHTEPFPPLDTGTDQPFDPGPPARLTANRGNDEEISFTPDGGELVYSLDQACVAFLPAHQARDSVWLCAPEVQGESDSYGHPAVSASRHMAFLLTRQRDDEPAPFYKAVVVGPLADLGDTSEVIPVPFVTSVDGVLHLRITRLAWLRGDTLAILADSAVYLTDPASATRPRVFVRLPLPGAVYSMQPGPGGSVLYLRLAGDTRVLAWDMATAGLAIFHDFGVADNTGQVAVGDHYLAAAIPGSVLRINLLNGHTDTIPTFNLVILELAIRRDGTDLVASAVDTSGLPPPQPRTNDLYRLIP